MSQNVYVVGVGMTPFRKPGSVDAQGDDVDYPQLVREAGRAALADAGVEYAQIEQAIAGYVYGDSTSGQRGLYELGLTGIPISNVNNNCSTGSTALFLGRQLIAGGLADCVLAVGFEKMQKGSLTMAFGDREPPLMRHLAAQAELYEPTTAPYAAQLFGNAGREHMTQYGTTAEQFARIAEKNHRHSANNPYAQFQDVYTLDQILESKMISEPLTKLQCSPTSDGSAAAVLASERFVDQHGLGDRAVRIAAQHMVTDTPATFEDRSAISVVGADMTRLAARKAYDTAGFGPQDVQVVELHDCFSTNELLSYEALGLCGEGEGGSLIDSGATTYGGRWVVNPSGGLISKGHPLGATGLAQCAELTWQLRGQAGPRQVDGVRAALQHNIGLGGAAVVTLYTRA
ncbi:acetyl-CoA acetyltransferase [Hamadaea flava]|uniref:propanoyl-CoA C-acyltransferase n=1 Tax=Hamadaea flava TaxID=1742688 RepID=A0ABV8LP95_9ACTN|nr:lipid-transfer protein [Hamadaea flava]MCP2322549.1 acetyl-CoA acetyltransferase [Hamadaea flava]